MAQKISNLDIGSLVRFGTIHGVPIFWKIGDKNHTGYPDNSVTLVSNQIIKLMCFDAKESTNANDDRRKYGNNDYKYSNIRQWMNSAAEAGKWYTPQHSADSAPTSALCNGWNPYDTIAGFLYNFSADEQSVLLDTTINVIYSGYVGTCTDKMFLLSRIEIGESADNGYANRLAMFSSENSSRIATITAEASINSANTNTPSAGSNCIYWLREPSGTSAQYTCACDKNGSVGGHNANSNLHGLLPACNLSGDLMVTDSTDSSGAYTIIYNQTPTAPSSITVPTEVYGGKTLDVSWGASTDADGNMSGYILERKDDDGEWAQVYKGSARTFADDITFGLMTVQYRVKAYDAVDAESAYTTSETRTVINNRTPVVSGEDVNLGTFVETAPGIEYSVTDEDGDQVTVVEKLDGVTLKSYTCTLGETNAIELTADEWLKILNGTHALTITATDARGASSTRTLTFTKDVTSIVFEQALAMAADEMPIKALVNIQGSFPPGSILTVWICNNGNDAEPTWEDCTQRVLTGAKHFFTNTTKTADTWGVKIKAELLRGTATETCFIQSIGGNFA